MSIFDFFRRKKYAEESSIDESMQISENNFSDEEVKYNNDLDFVDSSGLVYSNIPIQLAKDVPVPARNFVEGQNKKFIFPLCPGIFDYSQVGYIMPAWVDFHIIANKAGVRAIAGNPEEKNKRSSFFKDPNPMDASIVEGLFEVQDGIPLVPLNFNSPWKIFSRKKSISALMLPAFYHTNPEILENLYIYPGIVDYDKFHTANVICAVRKRCSFTIRAGEPLLHIIPYINADITCGYGPASDEEKGQITYDPNIYQSQFYRKHHQEKKNYNLEENTSNNIIPGNQNPMIPGNLNPTIPGNQNPTIPGNLNPMIPGTEIIIPGNAITNPAIPGTEIIIPGTEIINPGTLIKEPPKKVRKKRKIIKNR